MADPRYPVVIIGGASVVTAPAELDTANAEWFRKVLLHALEHGNAAVVVSMASTQFCDSAGVSALAWAHGHAVAQDAQLLLVIPAGAAVLRVFAIAGLDRLIPIFADLNEALEQAQAIFPRRLRRQGMPSAEAGLAARVHLVDELDPGLTDSDGRALVHAAIGAIQSALFHTSGLPAERLRELLTSSAVAILGCS